MRLIAVFLMLASPAAALADAKIQSFIPGLERELAGCVGQVSGNDKVAARAAAYVKTDADKSADGRTRSTAEGGAKVNDKSADGRTRSTAEGGAKVDDQEAARDAAALAAGAAQYKQYCDDVAGFVAYLKDKAGVPYKTVERELDERATGSASCAGMPRSPSRSSRRSRASGSPRSCRRSSSPRRSARRASSRAAG
jgi:hypothetical protein